MCTKIQDVHNVSISLFFYVKLKSYSLIYFFQRLKISTEELATLKFNELKERNSVK